MKTPIEVKENGEIWVAGEDKPRGICWCGCGGVTEIAPFTKTAKAKYMGVPMRYLPTHSEPRPRIATDDAGYIAGEDKPRGLCWCGCGSQTPIAKGTSSKKHVYFGVPIRYIPGHQNAPTDLTRYEVDENGCWIWTGGTWNATGRYPLVQKGGRTTGAYRALWKVVKGPVPDDLHLDHLCRVPACVNPDHLEPVTPQENSRRRDEALGYGRYSVACGKGHRWDEGDNLYISPGQGKLICRRCQHERYLRRKRRRTAA